MLIFVAPFGFGIFGLLALYDAFYLNQYPLAYFPAVLSAAFLFITLHYRLTKQLRTGILLIVTISTGLLLSFIYQNQNESFGLAWALLYPPFIIMTLGYNLGLRGSLLIYFLLIGLLISGIGVWEYGQWDLTGLVRFSLSYIAITYLSYLLALSNQFSYGLLEKEHLAQLNKHKEIERIAITDSLTGTYNRYYLNKQISELPITELRENCSNLIFFIAQIDGFKSYVDYYGYQKGDELLLDISQIIKNQMTPVNGSVYRITGSQFAGLVTAKDITKALIMIQEIQDLVNREEIPNLLSPSKKVHVSIGISVDNNFENFDFDRLFNKADEALYLSQEKSGGEPIILDTRRDKETASRHGY